ncbi:cyclophilin-like domain-containing protein [Schizophyllum fasciatum]
MSAAFLDIYAGNEAEYAAHLKDYTATADLLSKKAESYGLPSAPEALSEEQQDILRDLDRQINMRFAPPAPLLLGRLVFDLDASPGLAKTRANFLALCTGEKGACKNAPNKRLHYKGCPIHRVARSFVFQDGDITRGDGSGGESIYGGKFADEKQGLKTKAARGSLAMANAGKNSNSSQFFVVTTDDAAKLAKLSGKYVIFGQVRWDGEGVARRALESVDALAEGDGKPSVPVWIGDCGVAG